jgi:anti-sigma regulatory factor (Ser/Thr protein kinase)
MQVATGVPSDEPARLEALKRYRILDTDPERAFDDLTTLASYICGTPIALITLIDENRQWIKSRVGVTIAETARSVAFCNHTIEQRGIMIVPDAREDARFRENPFVRDEPHIVFYAGAPLVTPDGYALGSLCVLDTVARTLSDAQLSALDGLRRQAQSQLELRRNLMELQRSLADRDRAEAEQAALIRELRESLDHVSTLTGLVPFCSTCELNMVIPADPHAIPRVAEGVQHLLKSKRWPEEEIAKVELALQEALANAVRHGCKGDPTKHIQCVLTFSANHEIVIVVRDPGPGFDPTAVPDPLSGDNMFKSSGRGVFLINQLMDEVAFSDGGRELQMKKRRGGGDARESEAASNATQSSGPVTAATPESTTRSR